MDADHQESIGRPPFTYFQHAKTYWFTTIIDLLWKPFHEFLGFDGILLLGRWGLRTHDYLILLLELLSVQFELFIRVIARSLSDRWDVVFDIHIVHEFHVGWVL